MIEDNEGDIRLTEETLEESKIANNLHVAYDGEEGLDFLKKRGKYKDAITPDLILLDLNLPKMDGRELLLLIKKDEDINHIPVVVLTSSKEEEDILKSYKRQANCFIQKPIELQDFQKIVKSIADFWFSIVKLPKNE
jgi:CheY-like chemotaxis protein